MVAFLLHSTMACSQTVDLHGQRIGAYNLEEAVQRGLPPLQGSDLLLNINLSDNMVDDGAVQDLVNIFIGRGLMPYVSELDLTNNHISAVGLKALFPLLKEENFRWILLSINSFSVSDMQIFWEFLEEKAVRVSIFEESENIETLMNKWASKIVWLPREYDIERFPIAQVVRQAHVEYYRTH